MFTGIVQERGRLTDDPMPSGQGGVRLAIGHSADLGGRLEIGASLAVSGVCLTVTELDGDPPRASSSSSPRDPVAHHPRQPPPGRPRQPGDRSAHGRRLGGHWVQGHVDGTPRWSTGAT